MYITIDHASQFRDQFRQAGRGNQFSYEALNMLYEYLEDIDPQYELDVIALCCDYTEATVEEIAHAYGLELPEDEDEEQHRQAVFDFLNDHTSLVGDVAGGFLYANF
jgi:hypothetical protein